VPGEYEVIFSSKPSQVARKIVAKCGYLMRQGKLRLSESPCFLGMVPYEQVDVQENTDTVYIKILDFDKYGVGDYGFEIPGGWPHYDGLLTAHEIAENRSRVTAELHTEFAEKLWKMLYDELVRDGWIEVEQPESDKSADDKLNGCDQNRLIVCVGAGLAPAPDAPALPTSGAGGGRGTPARLRKQIEDSFSDEELRTLCFDIEVDYESLPAQGKAGKARELVACLDRRGRIPDLIAECSKLRPNVSWGDKPE